MKILRIFLFVTVIVTLHCRDDRQTPRWKLSLKSRPYADALIDGENFYVFSQAGEAIAGKIKTGKRIWSQIVSGPILGTPATSNRSIYLATQNGFVYSLNKSDGTTVWRIHLEDQFIAPIAMIDGALLIPSETGTLYSISAKDGSTLWRFSGQKKFNARPVVSGNNIFIGSWEKKMLCLRRDGSANWAFHAAEMITEEAVVFKNHVYFPSYDGFVYSLETQTGKLAWRYPATRPSNLVLLDQDIVFASDRDLVYLSAQSGKLKHRLNFGKIITRLYVHGPNLYVVSRDVHQVSALSTATSTVIRAPQPIFKLTLGAGMILALDDLYSIYGYATPEE